MRCKYCGNEKLFDMRNPNIVYCGYCGAVIPVREQIKEPENPKGRVLYK